MIAGTRREDDLADIDADRLVPSPSLIASSTRRISVSHAFVSVGLRVASDRGCPVSTCLAEIDAIDSTLLLLGICESCLQVFVRAAEDMPIAMATRPDQLLPRVTLPSSSEP